MWVIAKELGKKKNTINLAVDLFIRVTYGPRQLILYQKDLNLLA